MEATAEITAAVDNVPALRFPEFEGEWVKLKLDEVAEKIQDGTHFSPVLQEEGNYKYITSKNIRNGYMDLSDVPYLSDEAHRNIYKRCDVRYNDVLLTKDGSNTGAVCLNELQEEFSLLSSVAFIRAKKDVATNSFIYQIIGGPKGQSEIKASIAGQAITRITLTKLRNFKFYYPSLPEQKKIASFLSATDKKIQQLSKKKAVLEKYKKGAMQQIFSQQIRFKDESGNAYPEWDEKKLGEVFEFYTTNSYSRSLLNYDEGSVKNIHYGDIHTKFKSNFDITKENVPYINEDVDTSRIAESSYCLVGDLIIADASEDYKDIGKAIEIINLNNETVVAGLHTYIARDNYNAFALGFKGYLMQSHKVRLQMMRFATGVSVLGISKGNIAKVEIGLPTLEEQKKIVGFLTTIDNKINYTSKQLEQAQQFKKGLLQQLFV